MEAGDAQIILKGLDIKINQSKIIRVQLKLKNVAHGSHMMVAKINDTFVVFKRESNKAIDNS